MRYINCRKVLHVWVTVHGIFPPATGILPRVAACGRFSYFILRSPFVCTANWSMNSWDQFIWFDSYDDSRKKETSSRAPSLSAPVTTIGCATCRYQNICFSLDSNRRNERVNLLSERQTVQPHYTINIDFDQWADRLWQ